jgi:putative transposase
VTALSQSSTMHRTYTMRLTPTRRQGERLAALLEECREIYNAALGERKSAWQVCRKQINYYDQQNQLTELRSLSPESASFPSAIQRDPLRRVDRAMKAFFSRLKTGEKPGYPRFRSRSRYDSFTVDAANFGFKPDGTIRIAGLGHFRFRTRCHLRGAPKELRIKWCGNHWTATVAMDIGPAPDKIAVRNAVGIDLGLTTLATLSDGAEIENPHWTKREETRLAEANREMARKKRGSSNRAKARERLRRVHQRIAGLRSSYLHRVSARLVASYDLIAYEDLRIRNMVRSTMAKSIMDAAWNQLIYQLTYKAEEAGRYAVAVDPRGTTQRCSGCGEKVPKTLAQRQHDCPKCGLSLGRDHNAALNILRLGESLAATQNVLSKIIAAT